MSSLPNDYTEPLQTSNECTKAIPDKENARESILSRRRQAAASRLERLSKSMPYLPSSTDEPMTCDDISFDIELEDDIRDSIYLTKKRFHSLHLLNAFENEDDETGLKTLNNVDRKVWIKHASEKCEDFFATSKERTAGHLKSPNALNSVTTGSMMQAKAA